ncbi:MAG: hypothetical protein ACK4RN_06665 [Pseudorhodobacter sp.]
MDIDGIKDKESLEAWLNTRPREDAIAHRAALRVFSLFGRAMKEDWARQSDLTSLPFFWCHLISGVARKYPTPEISAAALSAALSDVWNAIRTDAAVIIGANDVLQCALWSDTPPDWFTQADRETRAIWAEAPEHWEFWTRWWDAVLAGTPLDWDLQHDIALIPDEVWKEGPGPVAEAIREIEARHSKVQESEVQQELRKLSAAPAERIAAVQKAMEANRKTLPPTFDAIEGLILLEIERLQTRNYEDELDMLESLRQIAVFLALHEAVCGLRKALPETGPITEKDAAKSEKLMRVYAKRFAELPHAKADEVVEGVWDSAKGTVQAGLILGTTAMAMGFGLPALAGVTIGAVVFAPGRTADIVKAAKDALTSGRGG